ncbi:MAG TPA: nucleoside recognition domain-containing protein [Bacillota bacterium]|nr:nucleoside recognition domain-containing protein [Bacillota bacterium]
MLNIIWVGLIVAGVAVAAMSGRVDAVTEAAMTAAKLGVETIITLTGIMIFWLGLARVAEKAGLIQALGRAMQPLLRLLFPSVPRNHRAMGAITANVAANMLGLGQAATPFGLKAMEALQELNGGSAVASAAMVTFLVLNTSGVTLIPATVIALRATAGSANPAEIVGTTLFATMSSTVVALTVDAIIRKASARRR